MAVSIREYRPEDDDACRALAVELQDSLRALDPKLRPGEAMVDPYLTQMHERCRRHDGVILLAEHDGAVVGLAMILTRVPFESLDERPGHYALVAELVVREGHRGHGIGRALLAASEAWARKAGATELRIIVMSDNVAARALYLRTGFRPYVETMTKEI
jgi:GNAT superfamily N-acetyltransferase